MIKGQNMGEGDCDIEVSAPGRAGHPLQTISTSVIEDRMLELVQERDGFRKHAEQTLAGYEAVIGEYKRLLANGNNSKITKEKENK